MLVDRPGGLVVVVERQIYSSVEPDWGHRRTGPGKMGATCVPRFPIPPPLKG
ncbi:hypothetical protein RSSM_04365 [Rhodopirellula sallentina SM41]|uniref:Uncharacterized protein n=1 Tax=Rhodopirellula sallentina SM41 TaxID=1263870 RepID=M5UE07_9BACT|nr:hypothetical protein RSSM_04365 [Rhodopirellula sallentina SM41]